MDAGDQLKIILDNRLYLLCQRRADPILSIWLMQHVRHDIF